MNTASTAVAPIEGDIIANIQRMVRQSGINDNSFYRTFRSGRLQPAILKRVFQQYYYYIRTFPQILAGTAHRVDSELIRLKLSRTVVSELGDDHGPAHFRMFEQVLRSVGVELEPWQKASYIPEAERLVDGLRELFLRKPHPYSLGAHYVIEEFGFPMIVALYEGFRLYDGWTHEDFGYFYLHMLVESEHVKWIREATEEAATNADARPQIEAGAKEVLALLGDFWNGLNAVATSRLS